MTNRSFYLDAESPKASGMSHADLQRLQRASVPGADRRTYPRPMTVYQRPPKTPYGRRKRVASLSEKDNDAYPQPKGRTWTRLQDDVAVPTKRRYNPLHYLAEIYGEVPESAAQKAAVAKDQSPTKRPAGWRLFLILLSGALPYIVVVLDDTIVATIIPVLVSEFQQPADIGWYATAYFLPMAVLMPVFGKCYSLWKIKWLFASCLIVLLIGSVVCGSTSSSAMFIVGRALSGAGAAGIINGAMRIIGVSSARKERTLLEAAGALVMGGCTVAGPILGGVIADTIGWRWAFLLNIPVAFGALVVILLVFPDEAPATDLFGLPFAEKLVRLDPVGALSLVGGLCCLVTLLQSQATSLGRLSVQDMSLATATGVLLAVFLAHEAFVRADIALIPRSLLRQRTVWSCAVTLFFLFAGFINFVFFLPVHFQSVLGQSAQQSAIALLPYVIASSVAAMLVGIGVSFVQYYNPFFSVGGLAFATGAVLAHRLDEQTTLLERSLYEAVLGLGAGFLILANVAPCHIQLEEKDHSVANGFLFLSSLLGATLSLPISSTIFNRNLLGEILALDVPPMVKLETVADPTKVRSTIPEQFIAPVVAVLVSSIQQTFVVGVVCAVCCAVATSFVPFKRLISDQERPEAHDLELLKVGERASGTSLGSAKSRVLLGSARRFSIV